MRVSEILRIKGEAVLTLSGADALLQAVSLMAKRDVGSLVVVEAGRWVGLLTFREVLRHLSQHGGALLDAKVGDVMDCEPLTAGLDMEVMALRGAMLARHARYVPIIDGPNLLGIVSFHDVARAVFDEQSEENARLKEYINQ